MLREMSSPSTTPEASIGCDPCFREQGGAEGTGSECLLIASSADWSRGNELPNEGVRCLEITLQLQQASFVARFHQLMDEGGGGGEGDAEALQAGCKAMRSSRGDRVHTLFVTDGGAFASEVSRVEPVGAMAEFG